VATCTAGTPSPDRWRCTTAAAPSGTASPRRVRRRASPSSRSNPGVPWERSRPSRSGFSPRGDPDYLSGGDRRRLHDAHDGIVTIVPLAPGDRREDGTEGAAIDPTGDIRDLFSRYFTFRTGAPPDEALTTLFEEVLAGAGDGTGSDDGGSDYGRNDEPEEADPGATARKERP